MILTQKGSDGGISKKVLSAWKWKREVGKDVEVESTCYTFPNLT